MKNITSNFSDYEIRRFLETLNRPVAWFINKSGNLEFCELNDKFRPLYKGTVWFKLRRSIIDSSGEILTRFWKNVKNSSSWQLFRNSRTGVHKNFDNTVEAALEMKRYFSKHSDKQVYDSSAQNDWPSNEQKKDFCDRSDGRIEYYIPTV